ncbi:MAG: hypothetical protein M1818_005767 [Claussenomyces sp. TS43310]|nr:MAG: hypothetical protein M1818_005767 [Claussenomyces sp. TS43310]
MPWQPLPRIAFAVATFPFQASSSADLPLELGDELYIIEEGGRNGEWLRGYLIAPPSLLAGLTSVKGRTLEARVFSGIFPRSCVEIREVLGDTGEAEEEPSEANGTLHSTPTAATNNGAPNVLSTIIKEHASIQGSAGNVSTGDVKRVAPPRRIDKSPGQKPAAPVPMLKIGDETPISASEPLVDEIASCLREWHSTNLHELLLSRKYIVLDRMSTMMKQLDLSRRQLLHNVLTAHELREVWERTVWDLVKGNKLFSNEVIVRDPAERGRVLTGDDSAVELTKLQSIMSLLDERPRQAAEHPSLHHLVVDVKAFVGASTDSTTLVIYLVSKPFNCKAKALSESYVVSVPPSGVLTSIPETTQMRTLFTDLDSADIGDTPAPENDLFLVVKIQQSQQPAHERVLSSRSGIQSREKPVPNSHVENPALLGDAKASRRSLMWGRGLSRNAPRSKLNSVDEQSENPVSRTGPPYTSSSRTTSERPKTSDHDAKITRVIGIGIIKLNSIMKQDKEVEQVLNIWSPAPTSADKNHGNGEGWDEVIHELMECKSGQFERSRKAERVHLHLQPFASFDAELLIKNTPTVLSDITRTGKMAISGAPTKPRSDIYITFNEAFLPRHALLSRSVGSAIPVSANLGGSNLQLTVEVRRSTGERIENCIFASSNSGAASLWKSPAVERNECWHRTVRLAVPPGEVSGCHLVMSLADAPNLPFAIAYLPLWEQQAFMRDGHHSLLLYRYDETTSSARQGSGSKGGYLDLPWNARGKDDVSKDEAVTGPMAVLALETYLCSTRFSQDKVLLGLLKWKEQQPAELRDLLKRLIFVPEIEIVKLLGQVFDAIFGILVENAGNDEYEDLMFSALVTVLGITHDRRFNIGPSVDQYVGSQFNYPFATPCLVRSFGRLLANPSDTESSRSLRATFKVVHHILKFITHARGQQIEKETGIGITSGSSGFARHLRAIFKAMDGLMRNTAPILVGSQTLAVQHFHLWLPELTGLLTTEEIIHIAIDFVDSCALVKGKLVLYKLLLIINYSRLEIFSQKDQRAALAANTVRWIAPHWGKTTEVNDVWREQVRLCCSVLASQVDMISPLEISSHTQKIIDSYHALQAIPKGAKKRLSLLFPTTYPFPSRALTQEATFDETLIELSATLAAISTLPHGMQLDVAEDELASLLDATLRVHQSILQCDSFPSSWLSMHIYHHKSTMKTLQYIASILLESFLPHPDDAGMSYNTELWKAFFTTLLTLVGSDALALETFPEQKRRAVWKIAGDIREHGAELLRRTWEAIGWETNLEERQRYGVARMGGYQVQYVPALVGPIVELCLSIHEGLRHVAVEVLQTMIASEWTMNEDLSIIQTELIDSVERLFESKPLTESMLQKLFINELLDLFSPLSDIPEDPLYSALKEMMSTVDEFLDLLVAVHSTDALGEASGLIHRLRLMEFLRDMQKEETFIRYVHQLANLQMEARNPTEAGLALRLHADLYDWDPNKHLSALADPEFPAQSHFERKERIYFVMIKHFEDGEAWSSALDAYKQLQEQYEKNVFDYSKLAKTQKAIATIYETISKSEKFVPKYFRVTYRGMGFPASLREKDFVFEGSPMERTSTFTDRMQEQHPSAHIVTSGDVDDVEGQFLHISSLSPHRDLEHHVFQRARVAQNVREHLFSAHPQQFSTTVRRNVAGPVQTHWVEKMVYVTQEPFPNILRRSEIIQADRVRMTPIQTGLERIVRKTQEMTTVEKRVIGRETEMYALLVEALSISVSPTSESSVARYRDLLPTGQEIGHDDHEEEEEEEEEPEIDVAYTPLENALKAALIDHAIMIKRSLTMFSKSPSTELRSCYDELSRNFESTFAPELLILDATFPRQPTPVASWAVPSPPPLNPHSTTLQSIPRTATNYTIITTDTSILDTPSHRLSRPNTKRFSFIGKTKHAPPPLSFKPIGISNGHGNTDGHVVRKSHDTDDVSSTRSHGRGSSRRSFFGMKSETSVEVEHGDGGDGVDGDWVTDSGAERNMTPFARSLTNDSRERPDTASSVGSKMGNVRKRLSMLKLGKKSSKASGLVDSSIEE